MEVFLIQTLRESFCHTKPSQTMEKAHFPPVPHEKQQPKGVLSPKSLWKPLFATSCIPSDCWLRGSHTISSPRHLPPGQCERDNELFITSFPGSLRKAELEFRWMDTHRSCLTWSQSKSCTSDVYIGDTLWGSGCQRNTIAMLHCLISVSQHRDLLECPFPCTNGWREISMLATFWTIWRAFEQLMHSLSSQNKSVPLKQLLLINATFSLIPFPRGSSALQVSYNQWICNWI